jgi:hypothetical protein
MKCLPVPGQSGPVLENASISSIHFVVEHVQCYILLVFLLAFLNVLIRDVSVIVFITQTVAIVLKGGKIKSFLLCVNN